MIQYLENIVAFLALYFSSPFSFSSGAIRENVVITGTTQMPDFSRKEGKRKFKKKFKLNR